MLNITWEWVYSIYLQLAFAKDPLVLSFSWMHPFVQSTADMWNVTWLKLFGQDWMQKFEERESSTRIFKKDILACRFHISHYISRVKCELNSEMCNFRVLLKRIILTHWSLVYRHHLEIMCLSETVPMPFIAYVMK